jgi:hypothetical protein
MTPQMKLELETLKYTNIRIENHSYNQDKKQILLLILQ